MQNKNIAYAYIYKINDFLSIWLDIDVIAK